MLTLHRLPRSQRILYTGVLAFMTAGTFAHALHQHLRAGLTPAGIAAWYRGNEDDPAATLLLFPKTLAETAGDVETALVTYVLALLVLGSIVARSDAPARVRAALIGGYAAATLAAAASPLLVRYAGGGWAWLHLGATAALAALAVAITSIAVRDMWARRAAGPRFDPARML